MSAPATPAGATPMVDHFDLTGRRAVVLGADAPAGTAIAFAEAGADLALLPAAAALGAGAAVDRAASGLDGLDILACALDALEARPFIDTDTAILVRDTVDGRRGNLIVVTRALGGRGLPNCAAYCAAHGAVANLVHAVAQELAPAGI